MIFGRDLTYLEIYIKIIYRPSGIEHGGNSTHSSQPLLLHLYIQLFYKLTHCQPSTNWQLYSIFIALLSAIWTRRTSTTDGSIYSTIY